MYDVMLRLAIISTLIDKKYCHMNCNTNVEERMKIMEYRNAFPVYYKYCTLQEWVL